jgi:hypothetical protein
MVAALALELPEAVHADVKERVMELLAALDAANAENAALRAERDERWRDWAEAGEVNGTGQPREAQP